MNKTYRMLLVAGLVVMPLAGASYARPTWPHDLGLDFWEAPIHQNRLTRERLFREELEQRDQVVLRRIGLKDEVIAGLIGGELTLAEAAGQFQRLNESSPGYRTILRAAYQGATDEERLCRNVIAFVEAAYEPHTAARANAVARYEAELTAMIAADPNFELP